VRGRSWANRWGGPVLLAVAACGGGEPAPNADGPATEDAATQDAATGRAPTEDQNPLLQPANFQEPAPDRYEVLLETTEGDVRIVVNRALAPRGADRFYNLVRAGFYDGMAIHRVVEGFVAEWGIHDDPWVNAAWRQATMDDEPVAVSNERGRVTFSKNRPDTRTVQVFINLSDNPELDDQGFSPFGEVVEGMEVVDRFHAGYGDGPPRGEDGVYQAMAIAKGAEYLADFPELDRIVDATVAEPRDPSSDDGP